MIHTDEALKISGLRSFQKHQLQDKIEIWTFLSLGENTTFV